MTIVAGVDRTNRASAVVREARELADAFGADLHVIHVLGQAEFLELERTSVDDTGQPVPMDQVRAVAGDIAAEAADVADVEAEAIGLVGDAADEIIRYAEEHDARYLVVGGRKRSPVGKAVFGSVTQDILMGTEKPVVTIMRPADG